MKLKRAKMMAPLTLYSNAHPLEEITAIKQFL